MIRVSVRHDRQNRPVNVEIRGHALFAEHGQDIVCAAVSILVQTVVFAADDLLRVKVPASMEEGYLFLSRPQNLEPKQEEKFDLLLETMLLGLRETARGYSENITYIEEVIEE